MQIKRQDIDKAFLFQNRILPTFIILSTILFLSFDFEIPIYLIVMLFFITTALFYIEAIKIKKRKLIFEDTYFKLNKLKIKYSEIKKIKIIENYLIKIKTQKGKVQFYELSRSEWKTIETNLLSKGNNKKVEHITLSRHYLTFFFIPPFILIFLVLLTAPEKLTVYNYFSSLLVSQIIQSIAFLVFFKLLRVNLLKKIK